MKLILTHKKQLKTAGDVSRFIRYCYGKDGTRPVVPVEGYTPGLPTGAPALDVEALLAGHHGGKAAKGRSIAFSSEYFCTREEALAHAPALPRIASAFRAHWAPESNAISIVHLSEGRKQWAGMWRLDAHLIITNSDGRRGLQWSREECQLMQNFKWLPATIKESFSIVSGKGAGVTRRTQHIPYPHAKELVAYEIGKLTDNDIEEAISNGIYGAARRRKDGSIISIEACGKRVNIDRARELVRVCDGTGPGQEILRTGGAETSPDSGGGIGSGLLRDTTVLILEGRTGNYLGHGESRREEGSACAVAVSRRRRRLSGRGSEGTNRQAGITDLCLAMRGGPATSLAGQGSAGAFLRPAASSVSQAARILDTIEDIKIFT